MGMDCDENPSTGWTTTEPQNFELSVTHKILRNHLEPMSVK